LQEFWAWEFWTFAQLFGLWSFGFFGFGVLFVFLGLWGFICAFVIVLVFTQFVKIFFGFGKVC
jgi:hypothetical protein